MHENKDKYFQEKNIFGAFLVAEKNRKFGFISPSVLTKHKNHEKTDFLGKTYAKMGG